MCLNRLRTFRQLVRFGLVGALATLTHAGAYLSILFFTSTDPAIANIGAFVPAFTLSFLGHHYWSFENPESPSAETFLKFLAGSLAGLSVNSLITYCTTDLLRLAPQYAAIGMVTITPLISFFIFKFWVFKRSAQGNTVTNQQGPGAEIHSDPATTVGAWKYLASELSIVALALAMRVHYVLTAVVPNAIRGDAVQYYNCAWNMVHHLTFSTADPSSATPSPDSFRDPGFPSLLALWLKFGPDNYLWYWGTLLSNAILGAATVWLVMRISRRWLSSGMTLAVGVTAAIWPHSITNSGYLLTETLFGFLCTLAIWQTGRLLNSARPGMNACLAGLAYGCASLTNAILTPFPLLLGLLITWKRWLPGRAVVVLVAAAMMLPVLWAVRNASQPTPTIDTFGGRALMNLIQGSYPGFLDSYNAALILRDPAALELYGKVDIAERRGMKQPFEEIKDILGRLAETPLTSLEWYFIEKPAMLWGWSIRVGMGDIYIYPTAYSPFDTENAWRIAVSIAHSLNASIGILAAFFLAYSLARLGSKSSGGEAAALSDASRGLVALLVLYTTAIYVLFQAEPRYSTPFRGFEFSLAGGTIGMVASYLSKLRQSHSEQTT